MKRPFLKARKIFFGNFLKNPTYQNYGKENFGTFNEEHAKKPNSMLSTERLKVNLNNVSS